MASNLRVLFLAAEADPLVKIGGLGDVAGSLPKALRALSKPKSTVDVRLALPFHGAIQRKNFPVRRLMNFSIDLPISSIQAEAYSLEIEGLPIYLISGPPIPSDAPVYSSDILADGRKFIFFSLAALELSRHLDWAPHIVHANDWHTAPALRALSMEKPRNQFFKRTKKVLGIHNLPFLGNGAGPAMIEFGLSPAKQTALPAWAQELPLPLGILSADKVVAASPSYAREITTKEFGSGLQEFLSTIQDRIVGILNGIDLQVWNPLTDRFLPENFDSGSLEKRGRIKVALQAELGLDQRPKVPLFAMINRMDVQKGVDLVPEALLALSKIPGVANLPWQIIILGAGDPGLEAKMRQLEAWFPDRARVETRYDEPLSRRIYGGADMLFIPSRYEPCGLTQMIGMHYGCVPVARAVGGLRDTIQDYDSTEDSTGFLFEEASPQAMADGIGRALKVFSNRSAWRSLQHRGMSRDFSWVGLANKYLDLYRSLISSKS